MVSPWLRNASSKAVRGNGQCAFSEDFLRKCAEDQEGHCHLLVTLPRAAVPRSREQQDKHPPTSALSSAGVGWRVPVNAPGSRGFHDNPWPCIFLPQTGMQTLPLPSLWPGCHPLCWPCQAVPQVQPLPQGCLSSRSISRVLRFSHHLGADTWLKAIPRGSCHFLSLWSRLQRPPASGGSLKSHLHDQRSFPALSLGFCSGCSHWNCLTSSGFQDCNHSCQLGKAVEDSVKYLCGLSLWRFCTIFSIVGFLPYFIKGSELSFQSPPMSPESCQTCCLCCWQALLP